MKKFYLAIILVASLNASAVIYTSLSKKLQYTKNVTSPAQITKLGAITFDKNIYENSKIFNDFAFFSIIDSNEKEVPFAIRRKKDSKGNPELMEYPVSVDKITYVDQKNVIEIDTARYPVSRLKITIPASKISRKVIVKGFRITKAPPPLTKFASDIIQGRQGTEPLSHSLEIKGPHTNKMKIIIYGPPLKKISVKAFGPTIQAIFLTSGLALPLKVYYGPNHRSTFKHYQYQLDGYDGKLDNASACLFKAGKQELNNYYKKSKEAKVKRLVFLSLILLSVVLLWYKVRKKRIKHSNTKNIECEKMEEND